MVITIFANHLPSTETNGPTKRAPVIGEVRGGFEIKSTRRVYENPWIEVREDQVIRADGKVSKNRK